MEQCEACGEMVSNLYECQVCGANVCDNCLADDDEGCRICHQSTLTNGEE